MRFVCDTNKEPANERVGHQTAGRVRREEEREAVSFQSIFIWICWKFLDYVPPTPSSFVFAGFALSLLFGLFGGLSMQTRFS